MRGIALAILCLGFAITQASIGYHVGRSHSDYLNYGGVGFIVFVITIICIIAGW